MKYGLGRSNRQKTNFSQGEKRLGILRTGLIVAGSIIVLKLALIQIIHGGFYAALASDQHEIYRTLFPLRGEILVRDQSSIFDNDHLYPLATNKNYKAVYAEPRIIDDPKGEAAALSPILEIPVDDLVAKLDKPHDPYEAIKRKISDEQYQQISALNLKGIHFQDETFRFYPEKNIGANVLGFVSSLQDKRVGQYGIEGYFDDLLAGKPGELKSDKDLSGNWIVSTDRVYQPAVDGADVILTLDKTLEYEACKALDEGVKTYEADAGALIMMNPYTGKIMAMCSNPDFDPNEYNKVESVKDYNNTSVFEAYEPGSIFKPITMSAAIDRGAVTPDTTYIDTGEVKIDKFTIRNSDKKAHGKTTMVGVLNQSLNLGMIFVVQQLGEKIFREYLENYGFGEPTGIQLKSEGAGDISSLNKPGPIYGYTASFGQGIAVTPLQMVQAMSVIANGGYLVKPYIVDEIRSPNYHFKAETKVVRKVIDQKTSTLLGGMMASVIKYGFGKLAQVPGYTVAGKTGTAQIADHEHGGYSTKTNHSFLGFAPVDNPAFVMIVKLENPQKGSFAESTATPIFGRVASFALKYLKIPPDDK